MSVINPKSLETRKCLTEALLILMKNKKIKDITISELCLKAGTSRTGYYRNFNHKEDLIHEYMDYLYSDFINELLSKKKLSIYDISEKFFSYFLDHKEFLTSLIKSNIQMMLLDIFSNNINNLHKQLELRSENDMDSYLRIQFLTGGLYQLLISWIKNGCNPDVQSMANIIEDIFNY